MLDVSRLSKSYGAVRALSDVSISLSAGEIVAVLGANGAGKSTLLRTISGMHRADRGEISLEGKKISGLEPHEMTRRGLTHVPEGRGVIVELTVDENLRLGQMGRTRGSDPRPVAEIYDLFPALKDRRHLPASSLSGGERQMLVIARAMAARPRVLLLDEPSLGLAPRIVAANFALVRNLVEAEQIAVLLVEQNARSALSVADRGVILNLGRVVAEGSAAALAADEALRRNYLGF